ncbi:hypothetical protein [Estrella lausannensis]|uniref:hypothetical protein n=1 Tax=Estrella lausannensis TaxID=483423 RepID=UPI0030841F27
MVERAFVWLKRRCRRLLLRWERIAIIWSGFATLGLILYMGENFIWIGSRKHQNDSRFFKLFKRQSPPHSH